MFKDEKRTQYSPLMTREEQVRRARVDAARGASVGLRLGRARTDARRRARTSERDDDAKTDGLED